MKRLIGLLFSFIAVVTLCSVLKFDVNAAEDEDVYYMGSSFEDETDVSEDNGMVFSYDAAAVRGGATTTRFGVDVSKHQGTIDWNAMKNAGVEFAIIRAGYRSGTTGQIHADPNFHTYMQGATAAGMKIGVYFYSQAVNEAEAREEANFVLGLISRYSLQLPVFMDYEWNDGYRLGNAGLSKDAATADVRAFFNVITSNGYSVGVYSSDCILANNIDAATLAMQGYTIWAARYGVNNGYPSTAPGSYYSGVYDLWQYTSKGTGSSYGVSSTYIDLDYWYDSGSFANADYSYVFNPDYYRATYSDLSNMSDGEAFAHYISFGLAEGRSGSPIFNLSVYKSKNPDLVAAFGNDNASYFVHFRNYGMAEGRTSTTTFDVYSYKNLYADLRSAFGNDLKKYYIHYYEDGYYEGRSATGHSNDVVSAVTSYGGVDYSAVYDYSYYRSANTDLQAAFGTDDVAYLKHFINFGMSEGRQAKSTFNVNSYRLQYADLRSAFGKDLKMYYLHYMNFGSKEGRAGTGCTTLQDATTTYNGVDYSAVYDFNTYISNYSDLKNAFGNDDLSAIEHFVKSGMSEGRQAKSSFNVNSYRLQYADLRRAFGNDLKKYYEHYMSCGKKEGRAGTGCTTLQGATTTYNGVDYSAVYDFNTYISNYRDLKNAFGNNDVAALEHFVKSGMSEGRQAKSSFDVNSYRLQYADLRSAFGNDLKKYYEHYMSCGKKEGRAGTGCTTLQGATTTYNGVDYSAVYDFNTYISNYSDLRNAFGNDDVAALKHFVECGMAEGRQAKLSFNVIIYKNNNVDLQNAFGNDLKSYYLHYILYGKNEGRVAA